MDSNSIFRTERCRCFSVKTDSAYVDELFEAYIKYGIEIPNAEFTFVSYDEAITENGAVPAKLYYSLTGLNYSCSVELACPDKKAIQGDKLKESVLGIVETLLDGWDWSELLSIYLISFGVNYERESEDLKDSVEESILKERFTSMLNKKAIYSRSTNELVTFYNTLSDEIIDSTSTPISDGMNYYDAEIEDDISAMYCVLKNGKHCNMQEFYVGHGAYNGLYDFLRNIITIIKDR